MKKKVPWKNRAEYLRAWRKQHKERAKEYDAKYYQKARRCVTYLNERLKHRYGITFEEKERMREVQNNRCAICGNEFENTIKAQVDHDHSTKQVRGLLCLNCNVGLGRFKENESTLRKAIKYLKFYKGVLSGS